MASGFVGPTVGRLTCRGGKELVCCFHTPKSCPLLLRLALLLVFGLCVWKWTTSGDILDANQDCSIGFGKSVGGIAQSLALTRKIGNRRGSEGLRSFNPSKGTNLLILIILAGDIEMNPGPRFQCRTCKKYCKAAEKAVKCEDCEKRFHASCVNLGPVELQKIESGNDSWYCSNCKAECSLCSGAVLNSHKAVQCDKCEMWVHNNCSFMSDSEYETMQNSNCTWICPKCDFFNFSDSFFNEQFNLESENRFDLLARGHENKSTETLNSKNSFISGLKFSSININSIRGKKLELLAFIDFHQSQILAIQETKIDNSILTAQSEFEKAEEFNGQFSDVFTKSEYKQVPLMDRSAPFMHDIVVTKEGVTKLLKGLNPSKALGPDELHPRVLKELAMELGPVFAHLFQQSIDTGEIPKEWSLANICPLFKKGDRSLARNYRPVSLTCIPCKLLEHIVCSNIMAHLDEHELLSDRQHAFRKWHSCETQLTTVINDWAKILDKKGQVDTFILDFEKAFDTPPHELLKSKLFSYGIGGTTLNWINAFLCFRQQRVVVNGIKSDWAPVVSGVPQGTVLGPLLFSLYINDISADIESEIRLFADDCVCYREIKNEEDTLKLQRDIDRLGSWARKWGMRFQPVKCNMMQLTNKRSSKIQANYTLEGTLLENVESIKYLGVTITNDLKWNTHISNVCTKANRTLGFLRRNLYSCPPDVKEAAYKGLVRPVLEYGSSVWDPHTHGLQEELEKVQNRAARFVTGNYVFETGSMTGILGQLKWESLKKRRKDSRLILLYKGLKGKARIPTDDLIPKNRRCRNQHSLAFQIPSASKEAYKSSFFPQTIRDWNDLPDSLVSSAEMSDDCVSKFASLVRSRD